MLWAKLPSHAFLLQVHFCVHNTPGVAGCLHQVNYILWLLNCTKLLQVTWRTLRGDVVEVGGDICGTQPLL